VREWGREGRMMISWVTFYVFGSDVGRTSAVHAVPQNWGLSLGIGDDYRETRK
jgi:hypothetical protein